MLMLSFHQIDNLAYVDCAGRIRSTDEFRSLHEISRGPSCNNRTVIVDLAGAEGVDDIPELRRRVEHKLSSLTYSTPRSATREAGAASSPVPAR